MIEQSLFPAELLRVALRWNSPFALDDAFARSARTEWRSLLHRRPDAAPHEGTLHIALQSLQRREGWCRCCCELPRTSRRRDSGVRRDHQDPWREGYANMRTPIPEEQVGAPFVGKRTSVSP